MDKYLGDALYAAMVYVLFRLAGVARVALWAAVTMTGIELFQLTGVPAGMLRSGHLVVRACGRLLGTEFSVFDLLAYAVGIGCIAAADRAPSLIAGRGTESLARWSEGSADLDRLHSIASSARSRSEVS